MAFKWDINLVPGHVERIYRQILERNFDNVGLVFWGCQLTRGEKSTKAVVRDFGLSAEYTQRFVIPFTPQQQVELCYRHFLARPSDPAGLKVWLDRLVTDGIDAVIDGLIGSKEYDDRFGDDKVPG